MRKKQNDRSGNVRDWTTKKLKTQAVSYYDLIYGENGCYGIKDIITLDLIMDELDRRGVEFRVTLNVE